MHKLLLALTGMALSAASPALADVVDSGTPEKSVYDGDFLIVAAGPVIIPSYEGSDDTAIVPGLAFAGRVHGIGINPRAAGIAFDVVPDKDNSNIGFSLGPVLRLRMNRSSNIKDPVVAQLGKLPRVFETGVQAGVTLRRVANAHDQLSIGAEVRWDVSGHGSGYIVSPSVSYLTPLSRSMVTGALFSTEFADSRYAHFNYDVTPAGSAASGLPTYSAHGGFKAWNLGMFLARDLNANLLDGGFLIGGGVMYSRLYGSAAETPMTTIRGSRSQWFFGGGLGYAF
mgnify:CR=1 FL=1